MILNPTVATVLDKAADMVSEVAIMPTSTTARGREFGEHGFDAETAIAYAMINMDLMDKTEMNSGCPHLTEIMTAVADFGTVPEYDRTAQDAYFEGGGNKLSRITRRNRRRNDVLMWARGLATTEVATLYRSTAEEFRARPEGEGVYDTAGTHERPEFRGGVFAKGVKALAQAHAQGSPMASLHTMALLAITEGVFQEDTVPDPEAAVVVLREDVPAARIAEIAQEVTDMLNVTGWTHTYLVEPETGAISAIGAAAMVVDLPLHMSYLLSPVHQTERRWAELWAFVNAVADYAGIAIGDNACGGCGQNHDNPDDRLSSWEITVNQDAVLAAVTGVRDTYATIAASDSTGSISDDDLDLLVRGFFGKGAEN